MIIEFRVELSFVFDGSRSVAINKFGRSSIQMTVWLSIYEFIIVVTYSYLTTEHLGSSTIMQNSHRRRYIALNICAFKASNE